ncbi:hypothetical protein CE91St46_14830 [Eubacteriales bacterium]|nr:hypothetical protein CE91St46_14830 [Eubacteriales bacterium]GKH63095.1 hypothetical protein CE91St47_15640 [Eubacteriales bacterium]
MAKEVYLLSYWMPLLKKLKEFKEIAKTEEPELRYILEAIDRTLANMFIETADEYGIKRYEDMMGIVPDESDTLDTRRFRVLTLWNDYVPYTEPELYRWLVSVCGSADAFTLEEHYKEYWLKLTTRLGVKGAYELISDTLAEMLPANLVLEYENAIEADKTSILYISGACCTAFAYCITHDIEAKSLSNGSMSAGVGVSKAGTHIITHDIEASGGSDMALNSAVGMGTAHTEIVTHDITSAISNNGNSTVANPVSTATVITILEN